MNDHIYIKANYEVLVWARESLALSRSYVVIETGISTKQLNQIELGEKLPTLLELKALSKIYKRTIATLLLFNVPKEKNPYRPTSGLWIL